MQISGNITDPEHKIVNDEHATRFRLAHTPRVPRDGKWVNGVTRWYTVDCWGGLAQHVADRIPRGAWVTVTSIRPITCRAWITSDGEAAADITITASDVQLSMRFDQHTIGD